MHLPMHVLDAPNVDESEDSEEVEFIEKLIVCALHDEKKHPNINN